MGMKKVAIKNERPGVMVTPSLRPPDEGPEAPDPTEQKGSRGKTQKDR